MCGWLLLTNTHYVLSGADLAYRPWAAAYWADGGGASGRQPAYQLASMKVR